MTAKLPEEYIENMRKVLGDELDTFLSEYDKPALKALRFNTVKVRPETIEQLKAKWKLEQVPWCSDGYYYIEGEDLRPGLSPYHDAGVFYIQEPSAMITAERAELSHDDIVLDLCAAPGGKSTQAAAKCGLLISNEPIAARARILSSNIERMGFDNVIVSSAYPDELAACFQGYFTRIIVDAPCSGEGMMRKDETAVNEWSRSNVEQCIARQKQILDAADIMLKAGGRIIYSTCTFEPGENEEQISAFLSRHEGYELISMETIYPHKAKGEGHFCAVIEKSTENAALESVPKANKVSSLAAMQKYMQKKGIHVLRCGVQPGEYITDKKGSKRYEPSHAEALAGVFGMESPGEGTVSAETSGTAASGNAATGNSSAGICSYIDLRSEAAAYSYLKGNVINIDDLETDSFELHSDGGWITVMYDGYPLGLGKLVGNIIKNHYPKGLRHLA